VDHPYSLQMTLDSSHVGRSLTCDEKAISGITNCNTSVLFPMSDVDAVQV